MLDRSIKKLEFIIENLYLSTNAVGIAIFDEKGTIAAECGNLDSNVMSDSAIRVLFNSDSLLALFSGTKDESFFVWLDGSKGRIVLSPVSKNLFLVIFYSKDVDIFCIRDSIKKFIADISMVLVSIE
ncbi:MAG: hypothetical protein WCQ47_06995, partial [bacterium]